jgi:hypothetical protein
MSRQGLLGQLRQSAAAQEDWLAWARSRLPPELAAAVVQAIPRGEQLVLRCHSAAWSARLRYALEPLAAELAAGRLPLKGCIVRVAPPGRSDR